MYHRHALADPPPCQTRAPAQAGSITVRADLVEGPTADQPVVQVTVADTGIGMPQQKLDKIFQPYQQVSHSLGWLSGWVGGWLGG